PPSVALAPTSELRLAAGVLWSAAASIDTGPNRVNDGIRHRYLQLAFSALVTALGTSPAELGAVAQGSADARATLAARLGIPVVVGAVDTLQRLALVWNSNGATAPTEQDLNEANLNALFGFISLSSQGLLPAGAINPDASLIAQWRILELQKS